jgi:hypothetical protein
MREMTKGLAMRSWLGLGLALSISLGLPARGHAQPLQEAMSERTLKPTQGTRIGVTSSITVAAASLSVGSGVWAAHSATKNCVDRVGDWGFLGCGFRGGAVLMGVTFGTMPIMLTLGSYIPHRSLGGRGQWYAALSGGIVGLGAGIATFSAALSNKEISNAGLVVGAGVGTLVAASVPVLALELSHMRQRKLDERRQASARAGKRIVTPVATALPGGAWLGVSGTL